MDFPGYSEMTKKWPMKLGVKLDKDESWEANYIDWISSDPDYLSHIAWKSQVNLQAITWFQITDMAYREVMNQSQIFHKVSIGNTIANIVFMSSEMLMHAQCFKCEQIGIDWIHV